jgi:4'-phosphopantetheinyl transferase
MIHLLYAHCPVTAAMEDAFFHWLPQLPAGMQQQALSHRQKQSAYTCLFGKVLLHKGFQMLGLGNAALHKVITAPMRKPFLPDTDVDFNIAHSGEYVVVALSETAGVGVDLEQELPLETRDFQAQLTADEQWRLSQAAEPPLLFYTYWTQKEAVLKATGQGMSIPMNSFEVTDSHLWLDGQLWHLQQVNIAAAYSCHVASKQPESVVVENLTQVIVNIP